VEGEFRKYKKNLAHQFIHNSSLCSATNLLFLLHTFPVEESGSTTRSKRFHIKVKRKQKAALLHCLQETHQKMDHTSVNDRTAGDYKNFPVQLFIMLREVEADGLSHIVSWQPHGRAFLVHDKEEFVNQVIPR
jgi:hypothetical protein